MFNGTEKDTVYIHWFEFCITHLAKKLKVRPSLLENRAWSTLELTGSKFRLNHPIDYLYEEFKKLKQ
jgi:hypothetical protein